MLYSSTRSTLSPVTFSQSVLTGLARDGGLLLPETFPDVSDRLQAWAELDYPDLAFEVIRQYADDIPESDLRTLINRSYAAFRDPDVTPVKAVGPVNILELFHGPTLAFKDVALQFLGNLFEYLLSKSGDELNIVAATSGDTGSAAIHGMRNRKGIRIFVMYPDGRVSPVQEMQMTSVTDDNVFNIALAGTFDDAQAIVKKLFGDLAFKDKYHLGAVNSINWARVLAQIVYYFYAAFKVMHRTGSPTVSFSVPTGNFGDIFAGYVAAQMGLPIDKLHLATNENDILSRFFNTGVYSIGAVVPTISPSMDIQISSNFERWLFLHANRNPQTLNAQMNAFAKDARLAVALPPSGKALDPFIRAGRADTDETLNTIKSFFGSYGYLLDPHTAVGVSVAMHHLDPQVPMICLATAHPAKFPDVIRRATGRPELATAPQIEAMKGLPTRSVKLPNDAKSIADFMIRNIPRT